MNAPRPHVTTPCSQLNPRRFHMLNRGEKEHVLADHELDVVVGAASWQFGALNPQPIPPRIAFGALNPQPLPPLPAGFPRMPGCPGPF